MPQSPDLSVNGLVRYTVPVWNGGLSFQADFYYNADSYFTVQNAPVEREEGYAVINAGIDFQPGDGRWRAGVFVKNVTDTEYRIYALDVSSLGFSNDRYGLPRWYGVSLSYDF
jgi:iron complex outermembrane receptor protein